MLTRLVHARPAGTGLRARQTCAVDPRANLVRLTPAGETRLAAALEAVEGADVAHFAAVPDPERLLPALRVLAGVAD
jgi:hypothetical protein